MNKSELLEELLASKEMGFLTNKGIDFVLEVVELESKRVLPRWRLTEDEEELCRTDAELICLEHCLDFKSDKLTNAYSYVSILARCSFARNIKKIKDGTPRQE